MSDESKSAAPAPGRCGSSMPNAPAHLRVPSAQTRVCAASRGRCEARRLFRAQHFRRRAQRPLRARLPRHFGQHWPARPK
eukprot:5224825-Prymnesium_polylepis.1